MRTSGRILGIARTTLIAAVPITITLALVGWAPPSGALGKTQKQVDLIPRFISPEKSVLCRAHNASAFGNPDGRPAGVHVPYVAVTEGCQSVIKVTPTLLTTINTDLPCTGTAPMGGSVFCGATPITPGRFVVEAFAMKGPIPVQNPTTETIRYSVEFAASGGRIFPGLKTFPDDAIPGTNVQFELVFGDPGASSQPSQSFFELDPRRKANEYPPTAARAWVHDSEILFLMPQSEIGTIKGVRFVAFAGPLTAETSSAEPAQEVFPGGAHAPFGFGPPPKISK